MTKQDMTWLGLINIIKKKPEHKGHALGEIIKDAKVQWDKIKKGSDPNYKQGKQKPIKRSKKANKTKNGKTKKNRTKNNKSVKLSLNYILANCKLSNKCKKEVKKCFNEYTDGGQHGGSCDMADCDAFVPSRLANHGGLKTSNPVSANAADV